VPSARSRFLLFLPLTLVALAFVFASTGIPAWIPPAPLVRLGIASPLTGMTRSFIALVSGHVLRAFTLHPLGPLVFAACLVVPVRPLLLARLAGSARFWWVVGGAFALVWIRQILVFR
jgi:hypothetical protein